MVFVVLAVIASLALIWMAWGIWVCVGVIIAASLLCFLLRPAYPWQVGDGQVLSEILILIGGVIAVIYIWHDPLSIMVAFIILFIATANLAT